MAYPCLGYPYIYYMNPSDHLRVRYKVPLPIPTVDSRIPELILRIKCVNCNPYSSSLFIPNYGIIRPGFNRDWLLLHVGTPQVTLNGSFLFGSDPLSTSILYGRQRSHSSPCRHDTLGSNWCSAAAPSKWYIPLHPDAFYSSVADYFLEAFESDDELADFMHRERFTHHVPVRFDAKNLHLYSWNGSRSRRLDPSGKSCSCCSRVARTARAFVGLPPCRTSRERKVSRKDSAVNDEAVSTVPHITKGRHTDHAKALLLALLGPVHITWLDKELLDRVCAMTSHHEELASAAIDGVDTGAAEFLSLQDRVMVPGWLQGNWWGTLSQLWGSVGNGTSEVEGDGLDVVLEGEEDQVDDEDPNNDDASEQQEILALIQSTDLGSSAVA